MNWTRIDEAMPDDGVVVETIAPDGREMDLKRSGRLWFFPDGSMYVYFTPIMWRKK